MANQTQRVMELLKRFNDGKKVCIDTLSNDPYWYEKSDKTIRRDLDIIKNYFPQSFELIRGSKGERGCYKAVTKEAFNNFLKPELLSLMIQTFNMASRNDLFDSFDLSENDKRIISKKIKELESIYEFKSKPFENAKSDTKIFHLLERSIKNQKCIIIEYNLNEKIIKHEIKPYKILFINENFYLACEMIDSEYEFSPFRASKIKTIENTKKTFHKNYEIVDFIKDIQTPFPLYTKDYKKHLIDIRLEIDSKKAYFFKSKNFLKSQKIEEVKDNGNIILSYRVTQELEVEEIIKKWLPYVKVLKPLSLKEKIEEELRKYLEI